MNDDKLTLGAERAEALGVKPLLFSRGVNWYHTDDIHRLLGEGVERYGYTGGTGYYLEKGDADIECLCIGIRPIKQESAEDLLRELFKLKAMEPEMYFMPYNAWLERARKLLGDT